MIEIGSFIKLQRTKQEMTLGELSEGIVSVSYLSKIENQKTQASPEIIQLLCNRLGIEVDNSQEEVIKEKCKQWYSMLFEVNNKEEIIATYQEIQELMDKNISESMMMFEIYKIRYFLVLGEHDLALKKVNELNEISSTFDNLQQYYWNKFKGNYNSVTGDYAQAMLLYKRAEDRLQYINLEEREVADLKYAISITHSKLRNTLEAIDYANKALEIFMRHYNFIRCAQCHNILGISYRRIRMYDKAIKNFNLALHLGKLEKNKQLIQLTNQNLGYLYSSKGDSVEAIKHYKEIIYDTELYIGEKVETLASLVRECYNIKSFDEAKEGIEYGLKLISELEEEIDQYKIFYYIIHTYNNLLNEEYGKFEKLVVKEFLPYLKKHKDYASIVIFAELIAKHYEKLNKYKDATKYYKEANFAYEQISNI
ncbi:helix-turn-helix domain-containing protein [Oceanobacillus massiliensis]|uniref:helix-turn-helix domain-containing protein n=1 Tax=Oceanobacillus massiliensis TaxID=1465765 RepID=UPI00301A819B